LFSDLEVKKKDERGGREGEGRKDVTGKEM
jgi:hypothetical protein